MKNSLLLMFIGITEDPNVSTTAGVDLELPANWYNLSEPGNIQILSPRLRSVMGYIAHEIRFDLETQIKDTAEFIPQQPGKIATVRERLVIRMRDPGDYLKALDFLVSAGKLAQLSDGVVRIQREESTVSPGIFFYRLIGAPPRQ